MEFHWKRIIWGHRALSRCGRGAGSGESPGGVLLETQRPQEGKGEARAQQAASRSLLLTQTGRWESGEMEKPKGPPPLSPGLKLRQWALRSDFVQRVKRIKIESCSSIGCWILLSSNETSRRLTSDILESQSASLPLSSPPRCSLARPGASSIGDEAGRPGASCSPLFESLEPD